MTTLNLSAIENAEVTRDPFPFFYLPQVTDDDTAQLLSREFPPIAHGGSYDLDDVELSGTFQALLDSFD